MAKILLVEDDNNLREIYEARLQAEGYEIVSARDGEEALSVAIKEKPDLVISDVMMPKISGFDMLDILRTTEETKNVKVIMMTALSQTEDKDRAEKLGADRYLVKSQVTLEDVAKVARDVLEGAPATNTSAVAPQPATPDSAAQPTPAPAPEPTAAPVPAPTPVPEPVVTEEPAAAPTPEPATANGSKPKKVIEPINDLNADMKPKLDELLAQEEAKEAVSGVAGDTTQKPGATTPSSTPLAPGQDVTPPDAAIKPPAPDTKIDPNAIAL